MKRTFFNSRKAEALVLIMAACQLATFGADTGPGSDPPVITEFSPRTAVVGDLIILRGQHLGGTTEVNFNGLSAKFDMAVEIDGKTVEIITWVPDKAITGPITVTTEHGSASTTEAFVVHDGKPVIESFSPSNASPATAVFIHGLNLKYATSVLLSGQPVQWSVWLGPPVDPDLLVTIPLTATDGPFKVISPYGSAVSQASFTVTIPPPITVSDWPREAEVGQPIFMHVSNGAIVTRVEINGVSAPFNGLGFFFFNVPTNATTGTITLVTPYESVTSPEPLIVHGVPLIKSVTPTSGIPGTTAQLLGENFENVTELRFDNVPVAFTRLNSETISFTAPDRGVPVSVTGLLGVSTHWNRVESQVSFTVTYGLIISRSGSIGGRLPDRPPEWVTKVTPVSSPNIRLNSQAPTDLKTRPTLILSWPREANGAVLEVNEGLAPDGWHPVPQSPTVQNDVPQFVIAIDGHSCFFRLANSRGNAGHLEAPETH